MSRVKGKDTKIETVLRSKLHKMGLRFRKNYSFLPGKPDIVFPSAKVAVFIDGNFWHGYRFRDWKHKLTPFWQDKIQKNIDRDKKNRSTLKKTGWFVVNVWEHDIKTDPQKAAFKIKNIVDAKKFQ